MMRRSQIITIIILFFFGCDEKNLSVINIKNQKCDEHLTDYQTLIENTYKIDLSSIDDLEVRRDKVYLSDLSDGRVVVYDTNTKEFSAIGETGHGPFKFMATSIHVSENLLYIYDPVLSKFARYDIVKEEFISEYNLNDMYSGLLLHADTDEILLYVIDRIYKNEFEKYVISFRQEFQKIDTLFTGNSNDHIKYFEGGHDFGAYFPLFQNQVVDVINDELYIFDNSNFTYHTKGKRNKDHKQIEYDYDPDYEFFIETKKNKINEDTNLSLYFFNQALKNDRREFQALYSDLITNENFLLFTLFASNKYAFLIKELDSRNFKILCSDLNYRPVQIADSSIYWVMMENDEYRLVKSDIYL